MRLNPQELDAIKNVIGNHLGEARAELLLHGSRVDDKLKGGDIDLLLVVDDDQKNL